MSWRMSRVACGAHYTSGCTGRGRVVPTSTSSQRLGGRFTSRSGRPKTVADYRWKLECHLLPAFGHGSIWTRSRSAMLSSTPQEASRESTPLSAGSVNATITLLAQILEAAADRDLIGRNPARGRGARFGSVRPRALTLRRRRRSRLCWTRRENSTTRHGRIANTSIAARCS